ADGVRGGLQAVAGFADAGCGGVGRVVEPRVRALEVRAGCFEGLGRGFADRVTHGVEPLPDFVDEGLRLGPLLEHLTLRGGRQNSSSPTVYGVVSSPDAPIAPSERTVGVLPCAEDAAITSRATAGGPCPRLMEQ